MQWGRTRIPGNYSAIGKTTYWYFLRENNLRQLHMIASGTWQEGKRAEAYALKNYSLLLAAYIPYLLILHSSN